MANQQEALDLIKAAVAGKQHSYSPYSKFRVGAAVLTTDGKVYSGCNVENASYGITTCAEGTAICKAVSEGSQSIRAIAITTDLDNTKAPCGRCRQLIAEFAESEKCDVIMARKNGPDYSMKTIGELLPCAFTRKDLLGSQ